MYETLELIALLTTYSVLIVHALARVALVVPSSIQGDFGPRGGL
jgi:hypothetical protein